MDLTRVLVADDNVGYGAMLSRFVASRPDMEVVGLASDGRQAVLMADVLHPDVVVMDLYMPDVDGFEATRRLKAFERPPRVVVVTAHQSDENRLLAEAAGADAFLIKQEVDGGLAEVIADLVGGRGSTGRAPGAV
jgi:DNA-binding NarL/FixJ family response regulator